MSTESGCARSACKINEFDSLKIEYILTMITIRCSTLPGYQDCPRRAAARAWPELISESVKLPTERKGKIYTAIGDGCHAGTAAMATQIMNAEPATLEAGQSTAIKVCREKAFDGVEYDEVTTSIAVAEKQVLRMMDSFFTCVIPGMNPKQIEKRRPATIGDDFQLSGMLDLESVSGEIWDWKFGHVWRSCKAQLGGYSILRKSYEKSATTGLIGCHTQRVAIKKPQPATERRIYDIDSAERLAMDTIQAIIRDIRSFRKAGNPACFPCNPMSMLCNPKYCSSYNSEWCRAAL